MNNKIGVGVITCNREEMFKKCIDSIPNVDSLVVVNDATPYNPSVYPKNAEVIQHTQNKCVGVSKNEAMRYLIQDGCDHIFIVEDDMLIKKDDVFEKYIKTAQETGIWHLNFAYHGPANLKPDGTPNPRQIVEYDNGVELSLNKNIVGSFSYFLRGVVKNIGYHDERFKNAWEHCELTYRIIKAGLHPNWWWFADVANSCEYIGDLDRDLQNSTIRKTPNWNQNMAEGAEWMRHKHGYYPTQIPDVPEAVVMKQLERIEQNYSKINQII